MEIVFEDDYLIVANKPIGIATLPDRSGQASLFELLSEKQNLWPVNRIDKRVSGLVLFAKSAEVAARLNQMISQQKIKKYYKAITAKILIEPQGTLVHYLSKNTKIQKAIISPGDKNAKRAELKYRIAQESQKYHLIEIELVTGRFHQIRAQLATVNSPILGDLKYGAKRSSVDGSIFLQCFALKFNHPMHGQAMAFEIAPPEIWHRYGF